MAGHCGFEASAKRSAMDRGYNWLRRVFDALEHAIEAGSAAAVAPGGNLSELANVGAGDERSAASDQHNRLDRGVFSQLFYSGDNAFRYSRAKGVDRGIVDRQDAHFAISTDFD
jgi:hypothetical protein